MADKNKEQDLIDGQTKEAVRDEVKLPDMFLIILHNDNYTTMDFVVEILMKIFHKDTIHATKIMLDVHNKGKGIVGTYTYDIALTKIVQVRQMAKSNGHPLKCTMEKA